MTDVKQSWIRKMSSFTVQEQSERSAALTADEAHLTFD